MSLSAYSQRETFEQLLAALQAEYIRIDHELSELKQAAQVEVERFSTSHSFGDEATFDSNAHTKDTATQSPELPPLEEKAQGPKAVKDAPAKDRMSSKDDQHGHEHDRGSRSSQQSVALAPGMRRTTQHHHTHHGEKHGLEHKRELKHQKDSRNLLVQEEEKQHPFITISLDVMPGIVIILNSLTLWFSLDYPEQEVVWSAFEFVFLAFYTYEIAIKFYLYGVRTYWVGEDRYWNWFDFYCLSMMIMELSLSLLQIDFGGVGVMKIFRLTRLLRLIRTLRFKIFLELKLMLMGVVSGLRVLLWAIVLLLVTVYLLGVAMRTLLGEEVPEFASVPSAMFTFFRCFTDGCTAYDGTPLPERLRRDMPNIQGVIVLVNIFLIMLVTIGIFNLIMAVFIDNVTGSQFSRKQQEISETSDHYEVLFKRHILNFFKVPYDEHTQASAQVKDNPDLKLKMMSAEMDELLQNVVEVQRETFDEWLRDPTFEKHLKEASIDVSDKHELFDTLDADAGGHLTVSELVTGLMLLRGPVTKSDVVGILLKVSYLAEMVESMEKLANGGSNAPSEAAHDHMT